MWSGWYFSEEIKLAVSEGYKVNIIKGYEFNRVADVFKSYITDVYGTKCTTTDPVERNISKSLLNNLLGRFGLDINRPISNILNKQGFDKILARYPIFNEIPINDEWAIISYLPTVDPSLCKALGIDIVKLINEYNLKEETSSGFKDVSVAISSAVCAYGRIHITKIKLDILKKGGLTV